MKDYKITWEVNQYRPDEFSDLTEKLEDYVYDVQSKSKAIELSFESVSWEMGGGRLISAIQI